MQFQSFPAPILTKIVSLRLTDSEYNELSDLVTREKTSLSAALRVLVNVGMDQYFAERSSATARPLPSAAKQWLADRPKS